MITRIATLFVILLFILKSHFITPILGLGCYWEPVSDYGNNDIKIATNRKNEECCCNYNYIDIVTCEQINDDCVEYNDGHKLCTICNIQKSICYEYHLYRN